MRNLFQRNWYTEVCHNDTYMLKAKTNYIDTYRETVAHLAADINSFVIKDAFLEEISSIESVNYSTRQVTPLNGAEAYHGSGAALKKAGEILKDPIAVALFAETIKGFIQAQNFLFKERGYESIEDYSSKRVKALAGTCRYFSNLDRATTSWNDNIGGGQRGISVFTRFKTQRFFDLGEDRYLLTGSLSDSLHEVNVRLTLKGVKVIEAEGEFLRTPDHLCYEAATLVNNLAGVNLREITKREITGILGDSQGCVHVVDLVNDCAQILELYKF